MSAKSSISGEGTPPVGSEDMDQETCLLRCRNFENEIVHTMDNCYQTKDFADAVLICEGQQFLAHQVILSSFSKFLHELLKTLSTDSYPIITIDGVAPTDMRNILEYMYLGSVEIRDSDLPQFFEASKFLRIQGLENGPEHSDHVRTTSSAKGQSGYSECYPSDEEDVDIPLNLAGKSDDGDHPHSYLRRSLSVSSEDDMLSKQYPVVDLQIPSSPSHLSDYKFAPQSSHASYLKQESKFHPYSTATPILSKKLRHGTRNSPDYPSSASSSPSRNTAAVNGLQPKSFDELLKSEKHMKAMMESSMVFPFANLVHNSGGTLEGLPQLFTTPSGLVVSTTFDNTTGKSMTGNGKPSSTQTKSSHQNNYSVMTLNALKSIKLPQPTSSSTITSASGHSSTTNNGSGGGGSGRKRSSLNYSPAQVSAIVESVDSIKGPFLPCAICGKIVKRERLRSHIYECHLVNGEKIPCPVCGVELKSKGSYRVHVWRHRKGSLKNRQMKHNMNPTIDNGSPS